MIITANPGFWLHRIRRINPNEKDETFEIYVAVAIVAWRCRHDCQPEPISLDDGETYDPEHWAEAIEQPNGAFVDVHIGGTHPTMDEWIAQAREGFKFWSKRAKSNDSLAHDQGKAPPHPAA